MQTFLPYPSFTESVRCLDNKRLGKQRVECKQIALALGMNVGESVGYACGAWVHHPAVLMWRGHEFFLLDYALAACVEWDSRGFSGVLRHEFEQCILGLHGIRARYDRPGWLGSEEFHASHRSNLLRKDKDHYGQFGWNEPADLPYVWPVTIRQLRQEALAQG